MKRYLYLTLGLALLLTAWQGGRMFESYKCSSTLKEYLSEISIAEYFNLYNSGRKIGVDSLINIDGVKTSVMDIVADHELMLFMDTRGCEACKQLALKYLKTYSDSTKAKNPTILISNIAKRDMLVMQKEYNDKFRFYKVDRFPFVELDNEETANPIFFSLNKEGYIEDCFLVNYDEEDALKSFIDNRH